MLNLVSECAQYGMNTSIHENLFIDYEIIQCLYTLLSSFGGFISNTKCWLLSEALDFNYSALDYQ